MIGMVLVTHGQLATEFKAALEHVVGPQEQLETITIGPDDDMETRRKDIMAAVCRVNWLFANMRSGGDRRAHRSSQWWPFNRPCAQKISGNFARRTLGAARA